MAAEGLGQRQPLRLQRGIAVAPAPGQAVAAGGGAGEAQEVGAIRHQLRVVLPDPVPLDHGELGMVQRPPLAVAEDAGEIDDARLAGGDELLGGELGRGVEVERLGPPIDGQGLRGEAVEMRLVARRDLQDPCLDLGEGAVREPAAQRRLDAVARQEERAAIGMAVTVPPGRSGHRSAPMTFGIIAEGQPPS